MKRDGFSVSASRGNAARPKPAFSLQNLLTSPVSEREIAAVLAATAGTPILPAADDATWANIRANPVMTGWLNELTIQAVAEADQALPALTDELYADFCKTGARLPFEKVYSERRRRLGRDAMAALLGDSHTRTRVLPSFLRDLEDVMDESSWSLPAHVWTQPTGKDPMTIDLAAAETANTLAELVAVFAGIIPTHLEQRIRSRLRTQFFENYLNRQPAFHWSALPMNWNAVCHQGVLGAALAIEQDHDLVARLIFRAARALPIFISGFGNDGSTSEGPGYWSYGFGWFAELNAQLEHRTDGQFSFLEGDPKIARIARFGPLTTFSNGHFVNFADSPRDGVLSASLLAYLGQRLSDPLLVNEGMRLYRRVMDTGLDPHHRGGFFTLSRLALRTPHPGALDAASDSVLPDVFFEDYGAVVVRGTDLCGHFIEFAAKGGHNAEHHNHNDCGSFILNVNGSPAVIEIGAPEYVGDYFSRNETRYTFLAARSSGHSVPLVNDFEQLAGAEFAASVRECVLDRDSSKFTVDLTRCYPDEAGCQSLIRNFAFDKRNGSIEVSDAFVLDHPGVVDSIIICETPVLPATGDEVTINGPGGTLRITPRLDTIFAGAECCRYNDHRGQEKELYRLRFRAPSTALTGTVGYCITIV